MQGFPADDCEQCLGDQWKARVGGVSCLVVVILICVLVPCSLETVGSAEVALPYNKIMSSLGDKTLSEGLQSKPTFGSLIKWYVCMLTASTALRVCTARDHKQHSSWPHAVRSLTRWWVWRGNKHRPITNQNIEMQLSCNSKDAIIIDLVVDFLFIPETANVRTLTLNYVNFQGYETVLTFTSRSSVRNACGYFTAREFQTRRSAVAKMMEDLLRQDLKENMFTTLLVLNLRNIDRPDGYQAAVDVSEAALADIELASKERQQKMIMANTSVAQAKVDAGKTIDDAATQAEILVKTAEQEVKESARADVTLALRERDQQLTQARTKLELAHINANKTLALARTESQAIAAEADQQYEAILDKYRTAKDFLEYARTKVPLTRAQSPADQQKAAVVTYLSTLLAGGKQKRQVAMELPVKVAWQAEL